MNGEQRTRMEELIEEISKASYSYYVLDDPYMSDMQWDRLYDELRALEAETGEVLEGSPTADGEAGGAERSALLR